MAAVLVTAAEESDYVHSVDNAAHALDNAVDARYRVPATDVAADQVRPGSFFDVTTPAGLQHATLYRDVYLDFATWLKRLDIHQDEWDGRIPWLPSVVESVRIKTAANITAEFDQQLQDWRAKLVKVGLASNPPDTKGVKRPPGIVDIVADAGKTLPDVTGGTGISIKTLAVVALIGVAAYYAIGIKKMIPFGR